MLGAEQAVQSTIAVWTCGEDLSRVRPAATFADMRGMETSEIRLQGNTVLVLDRPTII